MKEVTVFEDLLLEKYGKKGTAKRDKFDADLLAFSLGECLRKRETSAMKHRKEN